MEPVILFSPETLSESPVAAFARSELSGWLCRIFPARLLSGRTFVLSLVPDAFRWDGFSLTETADGICIQASQPRGLLHGVYELLKQMGCSFLFPGSGRNPVPKLESWPFDGSFTVRREPFLEYRGLCFYNTTKKTLSKTLDAVDWMAKQGYNLLLTSIHRLDDTGCGDHAILWDEIGETLLPELQKRGIVIDMSEHSTDYYFPKSQLFLQHPDWFAQVDGQRVPGQICYSNPEAVEAYGDALADFVKDKPWFQFFGIWPLDGGGYCECEHCKDPETIFKANRRIAQKIEAVRPDLIVEHLAYTPQSFARPKDPMPKNMSVLVCHLRNEVAYEWAACAKPAGGAFYFDYMTGDHYRYRSDVVLSPHYCRETVQALANYGYRGVVSLYLPIDCWFIPSINYWYLSRLYYEPTLTVAELNRQLAKELFGQTLCEQGTAILTTLTDDLLDPALWSDFSHCPDWYCEHLAGRNKALDALNAQRVDSLCTALTDALSALEPQAAGLYLENIRHLRRFVRLQQLYYHGVDQYDLETDTPQRAEPYFAQLEALSHEPDCPFISPTYARWRITGRDNIFAPPSVNLFGARD